MRQIEWRSGRLGKPIHPRVDQRPRVVRPRARLRVELRRAGAELGEVERLDSAVVEGDRRGLAPLARRDGEAVVLAGDEHPAALAVQDRVVRAAVAEGQLERLEPGGEA